MIGTTVQLLPMRLRGVSVVVNLQAEPRADAAARRGGGPAGALHLSEPAGRRRRPPGRGSGWPFGRLLNQGELYPIVHAVDGVEFVKILRLYETTCETGEQAPQPAGSQIVLEPDELMASGTTSSGPSHPEVS